MNATEIFVAHCGGSIMLVGTEEECKIYQATRDFNTSSWKIRDIEDYGQDRYDAGYDSGYDSGYENGSEAGAY